jgi:hypothetical protein
MWFNLKVLDQPYLFWYGVAWLLQVGRVTLPTGNALRHLTSSIMAYEQGDTHATMVGIFWLMIACHLAISRRNC